MSQPVPRADSDLKFVVVGDGAVGKTCLLMSYIHKECPTEYIPTVFDNHISLVHYKNKNYKLILCDTAGQEGFDKLRTLTYPQTDVFVICYAIDSEVSFNNVKLTWVPELQKHAPDSIFILAGLKEDLRREAPPENELDYILTTRGQQLAREIGARAFVECSAKTLMNVDAVFDTCLNVYFKSKSSGGCCEIM